MEKPLKVRYSDSPDHPLGERCMYAATVDYLLASKIGQQPRWVRDLFESREMQVAKSDPDGPFNRITLKDGDDNLVTLTPEDHVEFNHETGELTAWIHQNDPKSCRPSAFLADIIDYCPESGELQSLVSVEGAEKGVPFTLITRGETTAWKHVLTTEEVDIDKLPI